MGWWIAILCGAILGACVAIFLPVHDYTDGQKANMACKTHQGVRSMSTNQFNELNVVCRDGYAVTK